MTEEQRERQTIEKLKQVAEEFRDLLRKHDVAWTILEQDGVQELCFCDSSDMDNPVIKGLHELLDEPDHRKDEFFLEEE